MDQFFSALLGVNRESWGEFESIAFWPKYAFPEPIDDAMKAYLSGDERFVEPDLVVTFENTALIVEVKPPQAECNTSSNGGKNSIPISQMTMLKKAYTFWLWVICLQQQNSGFTN